MKKLVLAALWAATTASADAAVTYTFAGTEFDSGAMVSGSITVDTDALLGANGATDPALDYYFATGDSGSSVPSPFLSVAFTSTGGNPALLSSGDFTYQWMQADPSDGSFNLEIDWQIIGSDNSVTTSTFTLLGLGIAPTKAVGDVLLPDFVHAGPVAFLAHSDVGGGVDSAGMLSFAAASGVPEASNWAMMVLGFGAVGYAARRRVRVAFA